MIGSFAGSESIFSGAREGVAHVCRKVAAAAGTRTCAGLALIAGPRGWPSRSPCTALRRRAPPLGYFESRAIHFEPPGSAIEGGWRARPFPIATAAAAGKALALAGREWSRAADTGGPDAFVSQAA